MKKLLLTIFVAAIAFGQQNTNTQKRAPSQAKELTRAEFEDRFRIVVDRLQARLCKMRAPSLCAHARNQSGHANDHDNER